MSVDLHVTAFRPPDDKWKKMKVIWKACNDAGVPVPEEVSEFFNWENPDSNGVEVPLGVALREWNDEYRSGYQINISELPSNVKYIRAYLA
jgi:hypothetical protein